MSDAKRFLDILIERCFNEIKAALHECILTILNGKIIVAKSGMYEHEQPEGLSKIIVDAFWVGKSLLREDDERMALKKMTFR